MKQPSYAPFPLGNSKESNLACSNNMALVAQTETNFPVGAKYGASRPNPNRPPSWNTIWRLPPKPKPTSRLEQNITLATQAEIYVQVGVNISKSSFATP